MQFIVIGRDGTDEGAPARRMAAREAHLRQAKEMFDRGVLLFASAILNDEGKMAGSMIVCEFPSAEDLRSQWLDHEPYVVGKVWENVEVVRAQVPAFVLKQ
jgi:uncharacterized protein YciI